MSFMKKYLFLLLLFPGWIFAQDRQIIEVTSGDDLDERISYHLQYLFPEFTIGDVIYKDAPLGAGMINYNLLVGEMQFLADDEVMALANIRDIAMVYIDNRKFYPFNNKEFAEELLSTDKVQLRVRRRGSMVPYAKRGAYGASSPTSAITSYNSINNASQQHNLSVMGDVMVTLKYFYYLVGQNGRYTQINNVKAFTKLFPVHRAQIEAYAKENNIRFDNVNDLKVLLVYCNTL